MKNRKIKASAIVLAAALFLGGCTPKGEQGQSLSQVEGKDGKLFTQGTEINLTIGSHSSWPYNENWTVWKYFQEATGAQFNIQAIPGEDLNTKIPLMMATPEELPDLLHVIAKEAVDPHCMDGAFIPISDHLDQMPNYVKFFDSLPEEESKELMMQRKSGDGKIYFPPVYGTQEVVNLRSWMYRKDIFEKNGLGIPATLEEVYQVSKKLKELYPNSYPLCFRSGLDQIDVMGPMWKNDFNHTFYYDFREQKWRYGAAEEVMKDIIAFFHKMYDEQLVPPDFLTINSASWEALISTDRGFLMPEYLVRIDFFNLPARKENPDYTWAIMAPPKGDTAGGQSRIAKYNMDPSGYLVCNTGKQERIGNALKLLDWMYSDEGCELLSWGKENETYTVENGKKSFSNLVGDETPQSKYGFGTYGVYQRIETAAYSAIYTEEQNEQGKTAYTYTETNVNPVLWLSLNEEESKVRSELKDALINYTDEQISKFLLRQTPMSEWDVFQKNLRDMGVERMLGVYDEAYRRAAQ